jgi:tartrate dehydrogenase/decarboxylase/D-malate dehydrogenase
VFTRAGIERVAQYAADLARQRRGSVVSATKSNGLIHSMPFWDEVVAQVVSTEPTLTLESVLIDALAARAVLRPGSLDVVVASNLFGDILSDLLAALAGSIGIAPSANLNPPGDYPSMFEPVHGSAPDIAGRGIANPVGQMWAAAMMLDHLGEKAASALLIAAFEGALRDGVRTPDLGGRAGTSEFAGAVLDRLNAASSGPEPVRA